MSSKKSWMELDDFDNIPLWFVIVAIGLMVLILLGGR